MLKSHRHTAAVAAALFASLLSCAGASAATTVEVRVEGSAKTLFEGPVTTGPETIETASSGGPHPCNYVENGGEDPAIGAVGGPITALHDAAMSAGLAFDAGWSESFKDFLVTRVGDDVEGTSPPFEAWGLAVNGKEALAGGCAIAAEPGAEYLWAYDFFTPEFETRHLLQLSGAVTAVEGVPLSVHVVDSRTGEPISGATIGEDVEGVTAPLPGAPATDASGNATIAPARAGTIKLKATRPDSVRSNALTVCVHAPGEAACGLGGSPAPGGGVGGFTAQAPPYKGPYALVAAVSSIRNGEVFGHGHGPRLLSGRILAHTAVSSVSLELRRSYHGRCWSYEGAREEFVHARCGHGSAFSAGSSASFSYLLPSRLGPGRYVLDVNGRDVAGNTITPARGSSRLVFLVR